MLANDLSGELIRTHLMDEPCATGTYCDIAQTFMSSIDILVAPCM